MVKTGLCHLYWGDGKGKTTAAMGLALRALGQGLAVSIVQFAKDGRSGELAPLERLGAKVWRGRTGTKFPSKMTEEERAELRAYQSAQLREALGSSCDLLILDEACAASRWRLVEEDLLKQAVWERPAGREVVLTGRGPADWMLAAADYSTEMRCEKHPYQAGITARKGIEF